jgi:carbon starvation protein
MRESGIRSIGYGAMIVEMLVGIMALIAACAMVPGEYFAMNVKGEPAAVVQKVTAAGFPVTEADMTHLATQMGENNLVGRPGGATTFAVGMAQMFSGILRSDAATSLWYHFAIMFEALFILTTIDAGTRVGRFLMQDLLGSIWKPLANTRSTLANLVASGLFVAAWGWFLYQGVIDQNGGIRTLWPIFGIANQLLAVIALSLGATVLIKMGRVRYIWVMIAPLAFLLSVTVSAGYMKIFSPDPALGFLSAAGSLRTKIAAGGSVAELTAWNQMLMNQYINTAVTALFITLVLLIVGACVREWFLLLTKRKVSKLTESDYVSLEQAEALAR